MQCYEFRIFSTLCLDPITLVCVLLNWFYFPTFHLPLLGGKVINMVNGLNEINWTLWVEKCCVNELVTQWALLPVKLRCWGIRSKHCNLKILQLSSSVAIQMWALQFCENLMDMKAEGLLKQGWDLWMQSHYQWLFCLPNLE